MKHAGWAVLALTLLASACLGPSNADIQTAIAGSEEAQPAATQAPDTATAALSPTATRTPLPTRTLTFSRTPRPPTRTRTVTATASATIFVPTQPPATITATVEPSPAPPEPTASVAPTNTEPPPPPPCDPAYPTVCFEPGIADLDCGQIGARRFTVLPPDPHGFDGDFDGVGCESG